MGSPIQRCSPPLWVEWPLSKPAQWLKTQLTIKDMTNLPKEEGENKLPLGGMSITSVNKTTL